MMNDHEGFAQRIGAQLRSQECVDATFTARVMSAVWTIAAISPEVYPVRKEYGVHNRGGGGGGGATSRKWWQRPIVVSVTPLSVLATAAGFAVAAFLGTALFRRPNPSELSNLPVTSGPNTSALIQHDTTYIVRFVLAAPQASSVALVGDFNNWNRGAIQLKNTGRHGVWTASVALPAGQHEYAFIVDGSRWTADPHAPLTVADDFGTESSILTVGNSTASPAT